MLSDREKLILHFVAFISSSDIDDPVMAKMMQKVTASRCRSIAPEDVMDIVKEINEELLLGKALFEQRVWDLKWRNDRRTACSKTRDVKKNTNWRDMR